MASIFGHALTAVALGSSYSRKYTNRKFWLLGIALAMLPDADVIGFSWGIPYESVLGHRGLSHSLLFAFCIGILTTLLFFRKGTSLRVKLVFTTYFFLCTASHGVLDAMTTGGLGIAFFSPFDTTRYFFPWRPIAVSPIGVENFLGEWGKRVLLNEMIWIGIPAIAFILLNWFRKRLIHPSSKL